MVVAGVFLVIRIFDLYNGIGLWLVLFVRGLTILFGSVSALGQSDVKKVVAYSTTSQLGLIICSVRFGLNYLAFFHLCMHAFFKSMIFLTSRFFIHYKGVMQDSRFLSRVQTKFSFLCFVLRSISLRRIPFFAGFYSKDLILENIYRRISNRFMVLVVLVASIITVSYSFRVLISLGSEGLFIGKLSSIESLIVINFLVRLLFMTLIGGFFMVYCVFNLTEETYLLSSLKLVPVILVVSRLIMRGSYDLGNITYSYNPFVHRLFLGLFYYFNNIIVVVEFFLWEFFFSKFIFLLRRRVSSFVVYFRGVGGIRSYIGLRLFFVFCFCLICLLR